MDEGNQQTLNVNDPAGLLKETQQGAVGSGTANNKTPDPGQAVREFMYHTLPGGPPTIEDQLADLQKRVSALEAGKNDGGEVKLELDRYKQQLHDAGIRLVS